jgi:hypothetical protein
MLFENDRRDLYVDECCHLDNRGSQTLAEAIVAVIRENQRRETNP